MLPVRTIDAAATIDLDMDRQTDDAVGHKNSSAGARAVGCKGDCRPNVGCACHLAIQGVKPGYRQGAAM